jgi:23S rRNA (guanosine2251-2'-O)-methyltransferase
MVIYGINPVLEALKARRVTRLRVSGRSDRRIDEILALAGKQGVAVDRVDPQALDRASKGGVHQGVAADVQDSRDYSIEDLVSAVDHRPSPIASLVVVLDGIEDPHNVGAILRTCDAAGVTGVVRQQRHSASLDGVVAKASAGAVAHVRIATVVNIARAIAELKDAHVWTVGLAGDAPD